MKTITDKPHRRLNPLTGEWVLVSPHRTKRPWQGQVEDIPKDTRPEYDEKCYLCPGNTRANGDVNPSFESTYVFQNDFGALMADVEDESTSDGLLQSKTEKGICRVICFSPKHNLTLPLMEETAIQKVVEVWSGQYKELGALEDIHHVQIFENKGSMMGCSNPHPHGQIWAQSSIPDEIIKKGENQKKYFEEHGVSLLQDYLKSELESGERVIWQDENMVALVPYWAVWPFEAMILPKRHISNITMLTEGERISFASAIKILTVKYDNLFNISFPYSAGIHQAPVDGEDQSHWHWHMTFYPPLLRSATVKKFMVGYEMFAGPQRDITAESSASRLRDLSDIHYSKREKI